MILISVILFKQHYFRLEGCFDKKQKILLFIRTLILTNHPDIHNCFSLIELIVFYKGNLRMFSVQTQVHLPVGNYDIMALVRELS